VMALGQHAAASAGRGVGQRIAASTGRLAQRERVLGAGRRFANVLHYWRLSLFKRRCRYCSRHDS
jgi:hypothetical protein